MSLAGQLLLGPPFSAGVIGQASLTSMSFYSKWSYSLSQPQPLHLHFNSRSWDEVSDEDLCPCNYPSAPHCSTHKPLHTESGLCQPLYFPLGPLLLRRWELEPDIPGIACGIAHMFIFCFSYFTNWGKGAESFDIKYLSNCLVASFHFLCFDTVFRGSLKTQLYLGRREANFHF